jgi:hypothetical protein
MLTTADFQTLLNLIASDRVTLRGNEAIPVAALQRKLALTIDAAKNPKSKDADGDSANTAE